MPAHDVIDNRKEMVQIIEESTPEDVFASSTSECKKDRTFKLAFSLTALPYYHSSKDHSIEVSSS